MFLNKINNCEWWWGGTEKKNSKLNLRRGCKRIEKNRREKKSETLRLEKFEQVCLFFFLNLKTLKLIQSNSSRFKSSFDHFRYWYQFIIIIFSFHLKTFGEKILHSSIEMVSNY